MSARFLVPLHAINGLKSYGSVEVWGCGGVGVWAFGMGVSLLAGFVRRPPSLPEAKASGHPIPKPHE